MRRYRGAGARVYSLLTSSVAGARVEYDEGRGREEGSKELREVGGEDGRGADLGRMVRRSDHCLPSDSDKFTIKLHSLPSKFLSSLSLSLLCGSATSSPIPSFLSKPFPRIPFAPRELPLYCGHMGASSEESWYTRWR